MPPAGDGHVRTQDTLEVFIRNATEADILSWLVRWLGPLREVESGPVLIYLTTRLDPAVTVVIGCGVANGAYTSVMIAPNATPWPTDTAFARAAFEAFRTEVRCDPGPLDTKPWRWLSVSPTGETVVDWHDPDDEPA